MPWQCLMVVGDAVALSESGSGRVRWDENADQDFGKNDRSREDKFELGINLNYQGPKLTLST